MPGRGRSSLVARALAGHSLVGLTLAAFLYIVTLSGVVVVFNQELQRWEQPGMPEPQSIAPGAVQRAAEQMIAADGAGTTHFYVQLPTDALPRVVLTTDFGASFADSDGRIVASEAHPWTQFLLDLHYYLHLPGTAGLTVVGMLGVVMLGLAVSGVLAHPRIFRDAFRLRLGGNPQLRQVDLHNRLGVWTLPFHVAIALTGAVLGLASIIAAGWAELEHDGDVEAVFGTVFGSEPESDRKPAPLADIAAALEHMETRYPELVPTYVIMHEPATRGQHLQILAEHPKRLIFGDYYNFDADGELLGNAGLSDGTAGQQLAASNYRLHFGSFGGLPVKLAYAAFGVMLAYMIVTGMNVYLTRRRVGGRPAPRLEAAWTATAWGVPAALALTLSTSAVTGSGAAALAGLFWSALAAFVLLAVTTGTSQARVSLLLRLLTAAGLLLGAAVHAARHGDAFHSPAAHAVTLVAAALALLIVSSALRGRSGYEQTRSAARG